MSALLAVTALLALATAADQTGSSDVADAVEKLSGKRAHLSSDIRLLSGQRAAGPAVVLHLVRDDRASATEAGMAAITLIENAVPGSVIVAVVDDHGPFAVFGASFATLAKIRNLSGFVVDGAVRDLADLKRLEVTMLARGTSAGSAGGHYKVQHTGSVTSDGVMIANGDYIMADEDGVAVIPKALMDEARALAETIRNEERELIRLIEREGSFTAALKAAAAVKSRPPGGS